MAWITLALAIVAEVFATTMLKVASQTPTVWAIAGIAGGYAIAFALLFLTVRTLPLGVAYAIWSGAGTALVALAGAALFSQRLSAGVLLGIALIVAGVVVVQLNGAE